ncbi:hypothetical protein [Prosthecobacter sp.]|uniref:hypothetical protein n=1 Tax=Prosthecobacter sp. TaxID=1965333 RepID=UPI00378494E5
MDDRVHQPLTVSTVPLSAWPSDVFSDQLPMALDILGKGEIKHKKSEFESQFAAFPMHKMSEGEAGRHPGVDVSRYDCLEVVLRTEYFGGSMVPRKRSATESLSSVDLRGWRTIRQNALPLAPSTEDVAGGIRLWVLVAAFGKENHLLQWWYVRAY